MVDFAEPADVAIDCHVVGRVSEDHLRPLAFHQSRDDGGIERIATHKPVTERLAAAIRLHLGHASGPVPVYEIAEALDIVEIREAPMRGLEGALVTTPDRNVGSIVVNSRSHPLRRRFTLAHELGHFLNPWHRPSDSSGGFSCSRADMGVGWKRRSAAISRHTTQEIEANRFAIELLAPPDLMRPYLRGIPDLAKVLSLARALDLSREACARRYVEKIGRAHV